MPQRDKKALVIAVGTTYSQKIKYLRLVLNDIGIKADIIPTKVESGVSDQPISEEEISWRICKEV